MASFSMLFLLTQDDCASWEGSIRSVVQLPKAVSMKYVWPTSKTNPNNFTLHNTREFHDIHSSPLILLKLVLFAYYYPKQYFKIAPILRVCFMAHLVVVVSLLYVDESYTFKREKNIYIVTRGRVKSEGRTLPRARFHNFPLTYLG